MKKHLLIALGLLLAVCAEARIVKLNSVDPYTAENGDTLTTNGLICNRDLPIYIAKGATVTLQNFKLNKQRSDSGDDGAICCKGNATIILKNTNAIYVDCQGAEGIYIPKKATVTIKGDGYLLADARGRRDHYVVWSVGIGSAEWQGGGNLIIEDCTIDAYGSEKAPAIGMSNDYKKCWRVGVGTHCDPSGDARFGDITIKNAKVRAVGGEYSAGIGGAEDCIIGDITITGGQITAIGQGRYSPAIGAGGEYGECDQININDVKCLQVQCDPKSLFSIGAGHKDTGCGTVVVQGTLYNNGGMKAKTYIEPAWDGDFSKLEIPFTLKPNMLYSGKLPYSERITIPAGATVYFNNVDINGDGTLDESESPFAGITCEGDAEIVSSGKNTIKGFSWKYPGIFVPQGSTLILRGGSKDSLIVGGKNTDGDGAAGIGAYWREYSTEELPHAGNVKIISGNVLAYGGNGSAGIGGSYNSDCGNIEISGGKVFATGGEKAAGLGGGGYRSICGTITIAETASVTAQGGKDAPYSVGVGANGGCGPITVGEKSYTNGIAINPYSHIHWDGVLDKLKENIVIENDVTITGTLKEAHQIFIADGVTVKLYNVDINSAGTLSSEYAGLTCLGDATIILLDSKSGIKSFHPNYPGIFVPKDHTLTIKAAKKGSLDVSALALEGDYKGAAGIGAGYDTKNAGNIVIESGEIKATGFRDGAGIGSCYYYDCGNIEIKGGTVTATSSSGAGIGSGWNGNCGNITISGGTVTGESQFYSTGIGSGSNGYCGNITISDDVIKVTAIGADGCPHSVGKGNGNCGAIVVGKDSYTDGITDNPFTYPEACKKPKNVKVSTVLENSAVVSWTAGASEQKQWRVVWKKADSEYYSNNAAVTSCSYKLPNLQAGTAYDVKVKALCDAENESSYSDPVSFTTAVETECSMPKDLWLSNVTKTEAEVNWTKGKDYHTEWQFNYRKAGEETWNSTLVDHCSYALNGLTPGTTYEILVRTHCYGSDYSADFEPLTFTTTSELPVCGVPTGLTVSNIEKSTATVSWTPASIDNDEWMVEYKRGDTESWKILIAYSTSITLENLYPETNYEVRVQTFCGAGQFSKYSETKSFTTAKETCFTPTDVKAEVYGNAVTFSWTPGSEDQTKWNLFWKKKTESFWSNSKVVENVNYYIVENLMENTEYKMYMYADCGDGDYSGHIDDIPFTTEEHQPWCFTPTELEATEVVENEATFTWTAGSSTQHQWYVRWKKAEDKTYSFGTTVYTNPTYTLKGLTPETEYQVHVIGKCGKNGDSERSNVVTITTKGINEARIEMEEARATLAGLIEDMTKLQNILVEEGEDAAAGTLQTAIQDAQTVYDNTSATKDEINAAIEDAQEAYRGARNTSMLTAIKADFEQRKKDGIAELEALLKPGDSDACHNIVKEAAEDIEELLWDDEKSPNENYDALEALFDKAKADLEAQRQADKEAADKLAADKQAFEAYKQGIIVAAGALARDEDSEACKALIAKAKNTLNALEYDESKTLEQNKAEVDAVLAKLRKELEAQRASEQQGLDNVQGNNLPCAKIVKDGVLYLLYNGTMYNAQGVEIK